MNDNALTSMFEDFIIMDASNRQPDDEGGENVVVGLRLEVHTRMAAPATRAVGADDMAARQGVVPLVVGDVGQVQRKPLPAGKGVAGLQTLATLLLGQVLVGPRVGLHHADADAEALTLAHHRPRCPLSIMAHPVSCARIW